MHIRSYKGHAHLTVSLLQQSIANKMVSVNFIAWQEIATRVSLFELVTLDRNWANLELYLKTKNLRSAPILEYINVVL